MSFKAIITNNQNLLSPPVENILRKKDIQILTAKDYLSAASGVGVIITDENYQQNLEEFLELGLPTAVIAGNIKYKDKDLASEMGYPAGAIIVRDNEGRITNIEGKIFKEQDKGIEIKTLLEICQYVYTNNLCPFIYVWQEEEDKQETVKVWEDKETETVETSPVVNFEKTEIKESQFKIRAANFELPPEAEKHKSPDFRDLSKSSSLREGIKQEPPMQEIKIKKIKFEDFISKFNGKAALVIKADETIESGMPASILSKYLKMHHIELNQKPSAYTLYGKSMEEAIKTQQYSFGDLNNRHITFIDELPYDNVLFNLAHLDITEETFLNLLLEKAQEKYIVLSSNYDVCMGIIDTLIDIIPDKQSLKLITVQEKDTEVYARKYKDMVKFIGNYQQPTT